MPESGPTMLIQIIQCSSPGAWYADRIGQTLVAEWLETNRHPHQGIPEDVYWCREGGTYNTPNYVRVSDAVVVERAGVITPSPPESEDSAPCFDYVPTQGWKS